MNIRAEYLEDFLTADYWSILSSVLGIVAGILFLGIMQRLSEMQRAGTGLEEVFA